MRLYFQSDSNTLAIDTSREQYFSTVDGHIIDNDHRFITISDKDMTTILLELDFNGYANKDFLQDDKEFREQIYKMFEPKRW